MHALKVGYIALIYTVDYIIRLTRLDYFINSQGCIHCDDYSLHLGDRATVLLPTHKLLKNKVSKAKVFKHMHSTIH